MSCDDSFTLSIQLDAIHVEEVVDGSYILELVSVSSPPDYLTERESCLCRTVARTIHHLGICHT